LAGILPPLLGWIAKKNFTDINIYFVTFMAIIYVWQVAHFFLIVKIHETDYKDANLPIVDLMGKNFDIIFTIWIICYYSLIFYYLLLKPTDDGNVLYIMVILITLVFLIVSKNNRYRFYTLNFTIILLFLNTNI
jgi:heme O synthase-like polyprenyltransferase